MTQACEDARIYRQHHAWWIQCRHLAGCILLIAFETTQEKQYKLNVKLIRFSQTSCRTLRQDSGIRGAGHAHWHPRGLRVLSCNWVVEMAVWRVVRCFLNKLYYRSWLTHRDQESGLYCVRHVISYYKCSRCQNVLRIPTKDYHVGVACL